MGSPNVPFDSVMDCCDVTNSKQFMEALINFLNEAGVCLREVRQRAGSNESSPVQMNEEEKVDKMSLILCNMNHKYQMEKRKTATANQTSSASAMDRGGHPRDPGRSQELNERKRQMQERPRTAAGQDPGMMKRTPEQFLMAEYCGPGQEICYESGGKKTTFGLDQETCYDSRMMAKTPRQPQRRLMEGYSSPGQNISYEPGQKCPSDQEMCHEPGMMGKAAAGRNLGARPRLPRSFIEDCSTECKNVVRSGGKTW